MRFKPLNLHEGHGSWWIIELSSAPFRGGLRKVFETFRGSSSPKLMLGSIQYRSSERETGWKLEERNEEQEGDEMVDDDVPTTSLTQLCSGVDYRHMHLAPLHSFDLAAQT